MATPIASSTDTIAKTDTLEILADGVYALTAEGGGFAGADDVCESLVRLHAGLSETESLQVWAKLVLTLANHIGDREVVEQAIALALPANAA